jgi:hypothetical protein
MKVAGSVAFRCAEADHIAVTYLNLPSCETSSMLLKTADRKDTTIAELEQLAVVAPANRKADIEQELRNIRSGLRGEQEAAYQIDFHLKESKRTVVIHDLRLDIAGRIAQIDHILIHRTLNVFVLETKHLHAGIKITEEGEFLRWSDYRKTYEGMASPFAQNDRHIAVLKDAFAQIEMPSRMGFRLSPTFVSFVLVSPNARVDRPKRFDTSRIIKADVILDALERKIDKEPFLETLGSIGRYVSFETIVDIGRKLVALHKPAEFDFAARFATAKLNVAKEPLPVGPLTGSKFETFGDGAGDTECRNCHGKDLMILHGKFGYYFKCKSCAGNTPIRIACGRDGHKERIRKDARSFFRECDDCRTSKLFFTNPA